LNWLSKGCGKLQKSQFRLKVQLRQLLGIAKRWGASMGKLLLVDTTLLALLKPGDAECAIYAQTILHAGGQMDHAY
jgi:hypothetical protein